MNSRKSSRSFEGCDEPREINVLLVFLGDIRRLKKSPEAALALVLSLVEGSLDRYERIGILECPGSESDFLDADIRTIEIVQLATLKISLEFVSVHDVVA